MTDPRMADRASPARTGPGWGWILGYGVLSVVLGAAAFIWPFSATFAATLVVGSFFVATGAVSVGAGIFGRGHEGRGYLIGFGALSLLVGLVMVFEPVTGALSLTLMVAVWLAVRGVMELVVGARMRRRRGWMIALGAINIVLAVVIVATVPFSALTLPGYVLGLSFLFGGVSAVAAGLDHRRGAPAFAMG